MISIRACLNSGLRPCFAASTDLRRGRWAAVALLVVLLMPAAMAQRDLKNIPVPDPALEQQTFRVPEGFEVNLFAADPVIAKPIQMNFDEDGRLWIVSSEVYPQIKPGAAATDRVVVLEDRDHDGVSDATHVFAEGLLIPTGIAPGDGGAWVANSTELLHFADRDGDLKADSKRVVLSGFGTEDTHHILHTLRWGYDGLLYFNQSIYIHSHIETPWGVRRLNAGGIWQFRPETLELGVFMRGLVNSWGHHFDRYGQSFATDGAGGEGINYVIPGAYYFTAANADRILNGLNPGSPKHCGLELVETPALPPDWQGSAITNDFRGHRVVRFTLAEEGAGYVSREQQEVIWSDHVAFRPIDVKLGPDGAIYIADWYNPIIQHGEVDFRDDRRDHTHGRIWRVRWTGAPATTWRPLSDRNNRELFEVLRSSDGFQRQAAKQILRQRGAEVVTELRQWLQSVSLSDAERDAVRLEALWCIQAARMVDPQLLASLLDSQDGRIRAAAVRVLSHWKYQIPESHAWLSARLQDVHPRVRLEAVRAMSFSPLDDSQRQQVALDGGQLSVPETDALQSPLVSKFDEPGSIELALKPLRQPMDRFLDYGLWLTTRELSAKWVPAFEAGAVTFANDADQILFAFSAMGTGAPVDLLLATLYEKAVSDDQRNRLVRLIAGSANPDQLGQLAAQAARHRDHATLTTVLTVSADRRLTPSLQGQELLLLAQDTDDLLRHAALTAAGQWHIDSLRPMLLALVADHSAAETDRLAAFRGISQGQQAELVEQLAAVPGDPQSSLAVRRAALIELTGCAPRRAASLAGDLLAVMKAEDAAGEVARAFLQQKNGDELLLAAVKGRTLNSDVARDLLRALRESGRTAAELEAGLRAAGNISSRKLLSAEQRARLLELAASTASAATGERVYRTEQLGCLKCHAVGGAGGLVGPDMVSLGASAQPDYLLDSLLDPNAKVKENYNTIIVATKEGRVVSGIQIRQSEAGVTLRTADNAVVTIPRSDIEEIAAGVSLMPEGLVDSLTDDELSSLVRFLSELGRTSDFTVSRRRLARTWQTLLPTPDAAYRLQRTSYAQAASDEPVFSWKPQYTTVAGQLPLSDIPEVVVRNRTVTGGRGVGFSRTLVQVTSAGTIGFRLNSPIGLELRINEKPVDLSSEFSVDLPVGLHRMTFIVDQAVRTDPLQLELMESPGRGLAEFRN